MFLLLLQEDGIWGGVRNAGPVGEWQAGVSAAASRAQAEGAKSESFFLSKKKQK